MDRVEGRDGGEREGERKGLLAKRCLKSCFWSSRSPPQNSTTPRGAGLIEAKSKWAWVLVIGVVRGFWLEAESFDVKRLSVSEYGISFADRRG